MRAWTMPFVPVSVVLVVFDFAAALSVLLLDDELPILVYGAPAITLGWLGICQIFPDRSWTGRTDGVSADCEGPVDRMSRRLGEQD